MSATVTLDTGVLVCPPEDSTTAGVRAFMENLLGWERLLNESWIAVLTSSRAWEALGADGLVPDYRQIARLLSARGVREYSANDVMRVMDRLLSHPPWFEQRFAVDDAELHWEGVATEPDVLAACGSAP